jgi:hypothetical protein
LIINGILEKSAGFYRLKMVEGSKERPKPFQFSRDVRRIDRVWVKSNLVLGSIARMAERFYIRIFVRQANANSKIPLLLENWKQPCPRPSAA